MHPPTVVGNGHAGFCPALGYGCWLTQEVRDLLPAVQRAGFFLLSRHGGCLPYSYFDVHSGFRAANEILYTLPKFRKPSDEGPMTTDAPPRKANHHAGFLESDRI